MIGFTRENLCPRIDRPADTMACGPSGGLFGIDQEVVTLRGLSRRLRVT